MMRKFKWSITKRSFGEINRARKIHFHTNTYSLYLLHTDTKPLCAHQHTTDTCFPHPNTHTHVHHTRTHAQSVRESAVFVRRTVNHAI